MGESLGELKGMNEKTKKSIFFTRKSSSEKSASEKAFEDLSNKKIQKRSKGLTQSNTTKK